MFSWMCVRLCRLSRCTAHSGHLSGRLKITYINTRNLYVSNKCLQKKDRLYLKAIYEQRKVQLKDYDLPANVNRKAIFANNEVQLQEIEVYGFDYDYTLASYTPELHDLIYDLGRDSLVYNSKYPEGLREMKYDPNFAVRGLHYDVRKGLLMKIDSFHHIMLGTVYRGLRSVVDEEVKELYDGTHVPLESMNTFYGTGLMHQLMDLFALPEITLLANVTEYFLRNSIPFDPEYVFHDVRSAVQDIHLSGQLHQEIMSNIGKYLVKGPEVLMLLQRLTEANKKLFLITNSGFPFVDAGMRYIVGPDWQSLFDVVITNARKPKFFNEATRPFRIYDAHTGTQSWDRVHRLDKGKVYQQGNFSLLRQMTGWFGSKVFYFGDHVYSDLADVALRHGWRTGAIIPELENEIDKINATDYKVAVRWGMVLQQMIEYCQDTTALEDTEILKEWLHERDLVRAYAKEIFNPHFGSVFRTHHNPTYFSRRLSRFADLYMSNLTNLLRYSVDHTFYPRRLALPHESQPFASMFT
ncbi:5'-nucleotidase domain-containing protein 3 [Octopus bimaculoides]|uniref:5'-nucleotidase domain-containing protein 3 n=1 Tax=Octopus bimaculoides TaxID=37653 RepID=A0A0L8HK79_OCTBM|nr:5'-nucleotidase domain-containing protein 3 [Octopus bimaculoides]|eukprot:XP_014771704.1 PREDICTED: 5'-nucleotidase domain-containing protein 3-like [Octopus bimaculoides]